ncbi:MAG: GntR family transcriptional regulator [Hyphomonadaceae bacterium]|nr:GntR family transcriptional regulator [Hyphomonadaceae bacterium]
MSKSNEVYDLIIDRLVSAKYGFGERLLVKELSSETGASRQPIMSALNRLSAEGFVHIVPQVGCEVIDPGRDAIADFFRLFQQIEGLLAELAAQRRTEEDLMELKLAHQRLAMMEEASEPSPERYLKLNQAFHQRLHEMAYSPLLARKQKNNFNMIDFFISQSVGFGNLMTGGDTVQEHAQIVDAIEKQDSARASSQSQYHIIAVADSVLAKLG